MKRGLTLLEWLMVIAIVAILLAMAIPAFTRLKNHAPQTAEQPEPKPKPRFTATSVDLPIEGKVWLLKDESTGNQFLIFDRAYGHLEAVPLPTKWQ